MTNNRCVICGAELPPRHKKYCSQACSRESERRKVNAKTALYRKTAPTIYHEIVCIDCGKIVDAHIKSKRCPDCQREADNRHNTEHKQRKSTGAARKIGETYACENCGKSYVLRGGKQKWCDSCRDFMNLKAHRKQSKDWNRKAYADPVKRAERNAHRNIYTETEIKCAICGKTFIAQHPTEKYCSEPCKKEAARNRQKKIDAERNRRNREKNAHYSTELKRLMKSRELIARELADAIGVKKSIIDNYVTGARSITQENAEKLAGYFGVNRNTFIKQEGDF